MREDPNVLQCMKMENSLLEVTPIGSPIRKHYLHPIGSRAPTVFAHLFFMCESSTSGTQAYGMCVLSISDVGAFQEIVLISCEEPWKPHFGNPIDGRVEGSSVPLAGREAGTNKPRPKPIGYQSLWGVHTQ